MGQRRHHGEQAFERHLRRQRVPFVSVNEARKALVGAGPGSDDGVPLKSFDYVVSGRGRNLLVEVKCRRLGPGGTPSRLPCWVTRDDVESLAAWEALFGPSFEACLAFVFWAETAPQGGLWEESFGHGGRWYAVRAVPVREYAAHMKVRSPRWGTMHLSAAAFDRLSGPLMGSGRLSGGCPVNPAAPPPVPAANRRAWPAVQA